VEKWQKFIEKLGKVPIQNVEDIDIEELSNDPITTKQNF
jgi:hypothetical protein